MPTAREKIAPLYAPPETSASGAGETSSRAGERRASMRLPLRVLTRALAVGAASGAVIMLLSGVVLLRYLSAAADGFPEGSSAMAVRYLVPQISIVSAVYLCLGTLLGFLAWLSRDWSREERTNDAATPWTRSTIVTLALLVAGGWSVLAAGSMLFSPTSLAAVPVVREWRAGWTIATCLLVMVGCGVAARARWRRYAGGLAFLTAPLFLPDPEAHVAPAPADAPPHVFLLGIDNLGREGMERLAARVVSQRPQDDGVRWLPEMVSPAPLTRFAWQGLLLHRDPGTVIGMDTLPTDLRRAFIAEQPFVLPMVTADAGYHSTYVTDEAATNIFLPGEAFDAVAQDGIGWQVGIRRILAVTFPLSEGYVGRWLGVGVTNAPGATGTWRVNRAVANAIAAQPSRRQLVATHAVALHSVIRPTAAEAGGYLEVLRRRPSDLRADDPLSLRPGGTKAGATSIPQAKLYAARKHDVIEQTAAFIDALERAGHRRRSLIVVFTDHGELFLSDSTRNLPGLHGLLLEPLSTHVGALVLLPTDNPTVHPAAGGPRTIRGTMAVEDLAALVTEFVAAQSTAGNAATRYAAELRANAPNGGWLSTIASGGTLPRRIIPVRSGGRPTLGDDRVYGGRRTFKSEDMQQAVQLWPDGRITLSRDGVSLLDHTSDTGWTDGHWLVAYAPLATGGFLAQCFRGQELVREWRTDAPPPPPLRAPASDAAAEDVCR